MVTTRRDRNLLLADDCFGGNSAAVCTPSRNMLLSGNAFFRWKDLVPPGMKNAKPGGLAPGDAPNFPLSMKDAGYATYHHGKKGNTAPLIQAKFEINKTSPTTRPNAAAANREKKSSMPRSDGEGMGLEQPVLAKARSTVGRHDACRLMYVSDIHLRHKRSENLCRQIVESARHSEPDAILLGGDLVDRATELSGLRELVGSLCEVAPVMAVGGNHDRIVGLDQVRDAVINGGGQWIHDRTNQVTHGSRVISVSGPEDQSASLPDGGVRILCAHNPRIWKTARHCGYDLVLAGHLHGCQCVAFEYRDRLFPGAIFYPYCFLTHQCGSTRLVVSRGVSDLVPIRWRCPREVILCYV